jgi:SAM-dependent methyltransferase
MKGCLLYRAFMVPLVISNVLGFPFTVVVQRRQSVVRRSAYGGPSVGTEPHSDLVLHVGNLDWNISPEEISNMLSKAVPNAAQVEVKGLPLPIRKRDSTKRHGGSAAVTFENQEEAALGMVDLQAYSNTIIPVEKQFRVRWASIVVPFEKKSDAPEPLSPERIELRKSRAESYARRRQRTAAKTDEVVDSLLLMGDNWSSFLDDVPALDAPELDWSACHEEVDPIRGGGLKEGTARGERKRAAVEAFLHVLEAALLDNDKQDQKDQHIVADLGSGAGNLSLPLAWWLKEAGYSVVAVDINAHSLSRLDRRAETAGVPNIATAEHDLLDLISGKDDNNPAVDQLSDCAAVVSLHACGAASDLAMSVAVSHSLPFAISPCCIGKLNSVRLPGSMPALNNQRSAAPDEITYPRSEWLIGAVSYSSYQLLSSAADYGVIYTADAEQNANEQKRRRRCKLSKRIVEMDRLQWAKENGYHVRLVELPRIGPLYPKRELLLGAKIGSNAATKIAQLATTTSKTD